MLDVAIIGAGISGINSAYRLKEAVPSAAYKIFESRGEIGGTWSFFKYPGLRSDSDLHTFGFEWRPWSSDKVIATADLIMDYLNDSIRSFGADNHIEFNHQLVRMDWSSREQLWTLTFASPEQKDVKARWIVMGTGYYDYRSPLEASIPGLDRYKGRVVHPQFWPADLDVSGKRVAIIGSGATAITILPNIADSAEHVTMIQRSPSYIVNLPQVDRSGQLLKNWLPSSWVAWILRIKYLVFSFAFFNYCQKFPDSARKAIAKATKEQLPKNLGVEPHFAPRYGPWDQRLCMSPNGDFYAALRSGKASIVTGQIKDVSDCTVEIEDQPESRVDADILVTATGLRILMGGGATIHVDGTPVMLSEKVLWKGCMIQDVPNLSVVIGYTNASWTLGADVSAKTTTRLLQALRRSRDTSATPKLPADTAIEKQPFMRMSSTYLLKARGDMPSAGDRYPWLARGNYFSDIWDATHGSIKQDMIFGKAQ